MDFPAEIQNHPFKTWSTDLVRRTLKFHEQDRGTFDMESECRRMYYVQELGAELQRREHQLPALRLKHVWEYGVKGDVIGICVYEQWKNKLGWDARLINFIPRADLA